MESRHKPRTLVRGHDFPFSCRGPRLALEGGSAWPQVDLLHLAGKAVNLLQPLSMQRDIDLWLDGQDGRVPGEASLLASVLENLRRSCAATRTWRVSGWAWRWSGRWWRPTAARWNSVPVKQAERGSS